MMEIIWVIGGTCLVLGGAALMLSAVVELWDVWGE